MGCIYVVVVVVLLHDIIVCVKRPLRANTPYIPDNEQQFANLQSSLEQFHGF